MLHNKDRKETLQKMHFGFATDGTKLTFTQVKEVLVKSHPSRLVPIDELKEEQKQSLATNYSFWDDLYIGDHHITKTDAIKAVEPGSGNAFGKELVKLLMGGYSHIYRNFMQHDERKYPLVQKTSDLPEPDPGRPDFADKPAVRVMNKLSVKVGIHYIYSSDRKQKHLCDIPARKPEFLEHSRNGELWVANDKHSNKVVGAYIAYPGCTTWNIVSFTADRFYPSHWGQLHNAGVKITNSLKTYVCIWQVMPNGSLRYVCAMRQCSSFKVAPCYIGTSLVATQRSGAVISKFFVNSAACCTWSIDIDTPPGGEEIYTTGDNNYIFYQVKTPQDDMEEPVTKLYSEQITIPSGVKFLYASLFDSCNAYFAAPKNVIVTITSPDELGGYTGDTDKDESLYIQMTDDRQGLQKLCVKNPVTGKWTITIKAMTNTPVYFQFQTVPTKDVYDTMQATLPSKLGSNWKKTAFAGFTHIVCGRFIHSAVDAVGKALVEEKLWNSLRVSLLHNLLYDDGDIEKATNKMGNAVAPPSSKAHILLVDANGADPYTKLVYNFRNRYLYAGIELGAFRNNYTKLVGIDEAVRQRFSQELDREFKLVSVAGHGSEEYVWGYRDDRPFPPPILQTADVIPQRAEGIIFHLLACKTAISLGPALAGEPNAYIGYKGSFTFSKAYQMLMPDCTIDLDLVEGRTVNEAVENAIFNYEKLINDRVLAILDQELDIHDQLAIHEIGMLSHNRCALTVLGNQNARLT